MSNAKKLTLTALFAALCCVATYLLQIPMPYGYFNVGDVVVLLAGWMLGGLYGGVAAGVGSGLADILCGYSHYAPVTFVIKFLMAVVAFYGYTLCKKAIKKDALDFLPRLIPAIVAELLMAFGYLAYDCILYGAGGLASLPANLLQAAVGAVAGVAIVAILYRIKVVKKQFPSLRK